MGSQAMSAEMALRLRGALADLFELHDVTMARNGLVQLRGRLLRPPVEAYALAAERLRPFGYTPIFRRRGDDDLIQAVPRLLDAPRSRNWTGALLFGLTVLSMLFAGMSDWDPAHGLLRSLLSGVPFAATLLAILGAHELGHYFMGRHFKVPVSLPYFIPMPISPFGTMGAFIRLKAPPTNRRVLLAIAVAGPLAGLAVAVPLLVLGLRLSSVGPLVTAPGVVLEGNSLLYAGIKFLMFGRFLPGGGEDVLLHPVAFAAWAGLFVTGLNLIPAGQLDGGHAVYALIGERARYLTIAITVGLVGLGWLYWSGWYLWAALLFFLGQTFATPLDDITRLEWRQVLLAVAMLLLFVITFTPIPMVWF